MRAAVITIVATVMVLAGCSANASASRSHVVAAAVSARATAPALTGGPGPVRRTPAAVFTSGDSIIAGGYLPLEQRFTPLLAAGLPRTAVVDHTRGGVRLIDGDGSNLIDDWPGILAAQPHPSMVVLEVGVDDLFGSPTADWESAYAQIDAQAWASGTMLLACLLTPLNTTKWVLRMPQWHQFNAWLLQHFGNRAIDLPTVLGAGPDGNLPAQYDSGDGMHPNAAGIQLWATAVARRVQQ